MTGGEHVTAWGWQIESRSCTSLLPTASGKGTVIPLHAIKLYGGVQVQLHIFLTLALDGLNDQCYAPLRHSWKKKMRPAPTKQEAGTSLEAMENKKHLLLLLENWQQFLWSTPKPSHYTHWASHLLPQPWYSVHYITFGPFVNCINNSLIGVGYFKGMDSDYKNIIHWQLTLKFSNSCPKLNPDETQACLYYNKFTRSCYEKDVKIVANNTISGKYLPEYLL